MRCTVNPELDLNSITRLSNHPCVAHPSLQGSLPCRNPVQESVQWISEGRFGEALEVIRETSPLPSICGRVCRRFCEQKCLRAELEEPISFGALERFVADGIQKGKENGNGRGESKKENRCRGVRTGGTHGRLSSGQDGLRRYDLRGTTPQREEC